MPTTSESSIIRLEVVGIVSVVSCKVLKSSVGVVLVLSDRASIELLSTDEETIGDSVDAELLVVDVAVVMSESFELDKVGVTDDVVTCTCVLDELLTRARVLDDDGDTAALVEIGSGEVLKGAIVVEDDILAVDEIGAKLVETASDELLTEAIVLDVDVLMVEDGVVVEGGTNPTLEYQSLLHVVDFVLRESFNQHVGATAVTSITKP